MRLEGWQRAPCRLPPFETLAALAPQGEVGDVAAGGCALMASSNNPPLLEVKNLRVEFPTRRGTLLAVDDVSFDIAPGEVLGVVGESGAGKSLTGNAIIGLLEPPGRIAAGDAARRFQETDDGVAGQRLASARFAHHAQHLAGRDVEGDIVDREQGAAPRRELDAQVLHLEQRRVV